MAWINWIDVKSEDIDLAITEIKKYRGSLPRLRKSFRPTFEIVGI
jgi:hypothetical protein